jgi:hypothetical protein
MRGHHDPASLEGSMNVLNEIPFDFYGKTFLSYYCDDGNIYLPINEVCEAIGVDAGGQRIRL